MVLKLARLGVKMIPAMPAFYFHPETIEDLIDFQVGKILDNARIDHQLFRRWDGGQASNKQNSREHS